MSIKNDRFQVQNNHNYTQKYIHLHIGPLSGCVTPKYRIPFFPFNLRAMYRAESTTKSLDPISEGSSLAGLILKI